MGQVFRDVIVDAIDWDFMLDTEEWCRVRLDGVDSSAMSTGWPRPDTSSLARTVPGHFAKDIRGLSTRALPVSDLSR